jgi:hypothetical protein
MGRIVRAILIDPFKCSVTLVDHDASDLRNIYSVLSHEMMRVSVFSIACPDDPVRDGDALFYDLEGMMSACNRFFRIAGGQPICGKGLLLGADFNGEPAHCLSDLTCVRRATVFFERVEGIGLVRTFTPWKPHHAPSITAVI